MKLANHFVKLPVRFPAMLVPPAICAVSKRLTLLLLLSAGCTVTSVAQDDKTPVNDKAPVILTPYDWSGFYLGGHLGYAWGRSNDAAGQGISGSLSLDQPINNFDEAGNFIEGLQAGYNYLLPNRFLIGAEVDVSFPSYQNLSGISIGGTKTFTSPTLGPETYSETVLASGTARLRIGYAPGNWLFYATGGLAWIEDQQLLTQVATASASTTCRQPRPAGVLVSLPMVSTPPSVSSSWWERSSAGTSSGANPARSRSPLLTSVDAQGILLAP
jgi:opacity protein-like surface antigen